MMASLHSLDCSRVLAERKIVFGVPEFKCGFYCTEKEFSLSLISVMLLTKASAIEKTPLGCIS